MNRETALSTTLLSVLVALLCETYLWGLVQVYALNFSVAGPNATAALALLFVSGWTVALVPRLTRHQRTIPALLVLAVVALGVAAVAPTVLSLFAAVAVQTLLVPVVVAAGQDRRALLAGSLFGTLLFVSFRAWLDTAPLFSAFVGKIMVLALGLLALALWVARSRTGLDEHEQTIPVVGLAGFLLAETLLLGLPAAMSVWAARPYPLVAAATVAGLVLGAALVARRGVPDGRETVGWTLVFVAAVAGLLWGEVAGGVSALPAQVAAVCLLARATSEPAQSPRREAVLVAGLQFTAVVLLFLHISALNWAFVPAPLGPAVRGRLPLFLFATCLLFPLAVVARVGRSWVAASRRDRTPVDPDRRSVLGLAGMGALGLAGVGTREGLASVEDADASPLRVTTYNVHQFLAPDGSYNLEALRGAVADVDPHILGLQESDSGRLTAGGFDGVRWLAHQLGYHYTFGTPTGDGSYGAALLSRWPIERERVVYLPVFNSPPRPALVVDVAAPDGTIPVVVAHFQTGKPGDRRADEARRVAELVGDDARALVLADCNFEPDSEPYDIMQRSFTDAWAVAGDGDGFTYSASDPYQRIDYVWVGDGWTVENASVTGTDAVSDHRAVVATLAPDGG